MNIIVYSILGLSISFISFFIVLIEYFSFSHKDFYLGGSKILDNKILSKILSILSIPAFLIVCGISIFISSIVWLFAYISWLIFKRKGDNAKAK